MSKITRAELPAPGGAELKSARLTAGLSQVEAAELMGYPVQAGSRGGLQSRCWSIFSRRQQRQFDSVLRQVLQGRDQEAMFAF